jgi:hypothetical protein
LEGGEQQFYENLHVPALGIFIGAAMMAVAMRNTVVNVVKCIFFPFVLFF